jgi:formate dehydrogenase maturation protein FdhE
MGGDWRTNPKVAVALVIVIAIAIGAIAWMYMPRGFYFQVDLMCEYCGPASLVSKRISGAQRFPMKCRVCRREAVNRAQKCFDCEHLWTIKPFDPGDVEQAMVMPMCPKCDSFNIGIPSGPTPQISPR